MLLTPVMVFIVGPLTVGTMLRVWLVRKRGRAWFESIFLPKFASATIATLLATLVLIFDVQAGNITGRLSHVLLMAVPIIIQVNFNAIQVNFNAGITCGLMKWLKALALFGP